MLRRMAANLPPLKNVERLSSRVFRVLGGNPGKVRLVSRGYTLRALAYD